MGSSISENFLAIALEVFLSAAPFPLGVFEGLSNAAFMLLVDLPASDLSARLPEGENGPKYEKQDCDSECAQGQFSGETASLKFREGRTMAGVTAVSHEARP